jgi:hypothetical protein
MVKEVCQLFADAHCQFAKQCFLDFDLVTITFMSNNDFILLQISMTSTCNMYVHFIRMLAIAAE